MNINHLRGRRQGVAIHLGFIHVAENGFVGQLDEIAEDRTKMTLLTTPDDLRAYVLKRANEFCDAVIAAEQPIGE